MNSTTNLIEHTLAELTLDLAVLGYSATNGHVWFAEATDPAGNLVARIVVDEAGVQVVRFDGNAAVAWSADLPHNAPVTEILELAASALN